MVAPPPSPKQIFMNAVELSVRERAAYVEQACEGDERLRGRVEALLEAHGEASAVLGEPTQVGLPAHTPVDLPRLAPGDRVREDRLDEPPRGLP